MMRVSVQLAARCLLVSKSRVLLTGLFVFLAAALLTLSAALETGMRLGISTAISQHYTGDIVLIAANQPRPDFMFSPVDRPLEPIVDYRELRSFLLGQNYIADFMPGTYQRALVLNEFGSPVPLWINAVTIRDYGKFFPDALETDSPMNLLDQPGIWLTPAVQTSLKHATGLYYGPTGGPSKGQSTLTLMAGFNQQIGDIAAPINGLIRYTALAGVFQHVNLMDSALYGIAGSGGETAVSGNVRAVQAGYNYVAIRIFHPEAVGMYAVLLNAELKKAQLRVRALTWYQAVRQLMVIVDYYAKLLHGVEWLIMAVSGILLAMMWCTDIASRSLMFSVIRVIGGSKSVLMRWCVLELGIPAGLFGGSGMLAGWAMVHAIRFLHLPLRHDISQIAGGGTVMNPVFGAEDMMAVLLKVLLIIGFAIVIPILQIRRTPLLHAVSEDR